MTPASNTPVKKHVTSACTFCRRRKIKCDGETPVCSNCQLNGGICRYNAQDDKRKISPKKVIESLTTRIKQLEQTLDEYGVEIPPPTDGTLGRIASSENHVNQIDAVRNPQRPSPKTDIPRNTPGHSESTPATQNVTPAAGAEESSSSEGDSVADDLAAQMGSLKIAEDGQLRYYGPTSNLHIVHNGLFSLSRSTIRYVHGEGQAALDRAGLGQKVDPAVEAHLIKLYFAWEDPSIHVVDEDMFYASKRNASSGKSSTTCYSETLNNTMCAIGACLSVGVKLGLPEPASEFFAARAKVLLDIEMDSPTLATVQALVVMSGYEAAFMRDARGWLYSGMAVRLSADLGLHLDLAEHVRKSVLTERELGVRRTVFWGVFIHDNMWSVYVGRPWGMRSGDIAVSRPSRQIDSIRNKVWTPYRSSQEPSCERLFDPVEACADANACLAEMMNTINRALYAARRKPVSEILKFAADMREEFASWQQSLSEELRINSTNPDRIYLPHALELHSTLSIFVHRPLFSRHLLRQTHLSPSDQAVEVAKSRHHCISAAHSISEIIQVYRKQHTLRRTCIQMVHLVFTAGLVHVYQACTSTGAAATIAMDGLQVCCHALSEMGQAWRNATRALEVIICVKREWQRKAAVNSTKRPSESFETGDVSAGHRPRRRRVFESSNDQPPPDSHEEALSNASQLDSDGRKSAPVSVSASDHSHSIHGTNPITMDSSSTTSTSQADTWYFLHEPDLNFEVGDDKEETPSLNLPGISKNDDDDDDLVSMMDQFGDPMAAEDDPFAFGIFSDSGFGAGVFGA